jgi:ABC-type multidrug transport system fused ATPase/permease subunit
VSLIISCISEAPLNPLASYLRSRLTLRSFNNAFAFSLPTLATVVSFVIYSASGHPLEPGIIFSSLSLFVLLRTPMTFLRRFSHINRPCVYAKSYLSAVALNAITDASSAVQRLQPIFMAETRPETLPVDPALPVAVSAKGVDLTWDLPPTAPTAKPKKPVATAEKSFIGRIKARFGGIKTTTASAPIPKVEGAPIEKPPVKEAFKMDDLNLEIPRGQLCAIVGPVGSGKSSLLQGLIGGTLDFSIVDGGSFRSQKCVKPVVRYLLVGLLDTAHKPHGSRCVVYRSVATCV